MKYTVSHGHEVLFTTNLISVVAHALNLRKEAVARIEANRTTQLHCNNHDLWFGKCSQVEVDKTE